ncbi:MAG: Arsenite oxidase subunit AioB precursor [Pseudomonadota bacterium]|jgi:Rieske Fe-S protein
MQDESQTCPADDQRRTLLHSVGCLAAAAVSSGLGSAAIGKVSFKPYDSSLLVNEFGDPIRSKDLAIAEPYVFNYPFQGTPAFLIRLASPTVSKTLRTEQGQSYQSLAGVGPNQSVVAFSAICAHKMMYPTPNISFIGLRKGVGREPSAVIHCCGDDSRYDPAQGAQVIGGPAPQPLACVVLQHDPKTDHLRAVGTLGGEMFKAFFQKYEFKLQLDSGPKSKHLCSSTTVCKELKRYSRQLQGCPA